LDVEEHARALSFELGSQTNSCLPSDPESDNPERDDSFFLTFFLFGQKSVLASTHALSASCNHFFSIKYFAASGFDQSVT